MKTWKLAAVFTLILMATNAEAQTVKVRGAYNGWGYQPGYEYNPQTGWAKTTGPAGAFHFRPESGFTSPPVPIRRAPLERGRPGVRYNYGRPYLDKGGNFGNIRTQPQGGWMNNNYNW